jgi:hypothetical protein
MKTTRLACKFLNQTVAVAMAAVITISPVAPVFAADHRDSPAINGDGRADLLDVYAFLNPNDPSKVVLALTVNPLTIGGAAQIAFADDVLYQFKIDNNGDFKEDLVIQAIFTPAVPGPQQFTVLGPTKPKKTGAQNAVLKTGETITGPADGTITTQGDVKVFAGLRDEPFFFDQIFIFRALGILPGGAITNRGPGINFYAGLNVSALCVEVPAAALRGAEGNQTIRVWSTTSRSVVTKRSTTKPNKDTPSYVQIDRTALPTLNTVLIPKPLKDAFNQTTPDRDVALYANVASNSLFAINSDAAYSDTTARTVLLPDVLTLDLTSTGGFPNGRRPQDDVIDAVLNIASNGAVTSDNVPTNDKTFLSDFPFLATPHDPSEVIPGRN